MDYLFCSPSSLFEEERKEDFDTKTSSDSNSLPQIVESSCSEQSEVTTSSSQHSQVNSHPLPFPGTASPSAICKPRKYSTGIASKADTKHPVFHGRKVVEVSSIGSVLSTPPRNRNIMQIPRSAPAKSPRPALASSPRSSTKSMNGPKRSVAPLPEGSEGQSVGKPVLHRASSAPAQQDQARNLRIHPVPLRLNAWSQPAAETFNIRGPTYLEDKNKIPSQEAAFRLLTVDMVQAEQPVYTGMCAHPQERIQQALRRERETGIKELPEFVFAVNLCIPGDKTYHQVSYFGIDNFDEIKHPKTPFGRLMNEFIFSDSDDFRLKTFKLIPRIVEGNFVVRKAVGSKPTILGRKIKHYFVRADNYFEIIVDIASDQVAQRIVKLVLGYTKSLVVDMMFLLEADHDQYLPERIFGGVRLKNIDLRKDGARKVGQP